MTPEELSRLFSAEHRYHTARQMLGDIDRLRDVVQRGADKIALSVFVQPQGHADFYFPFPKAPFSAKTLVDILQIHVGIEVLEAGIELRAIGIDPQEFQG